MKMKSIQQSAFKTSQTTSTQIDDAWEKKSLKSNKPEKYKNYKLVTN